MKPRLDTIGALDAIYAEAVRPRSDWLASAVEVLRPSLDAGLGIVAYEFDLRGEGVSIGSSLRMLGDADLIRTVRETFGASTKSLLDIVYGTGAVITLNQVLGVSVHDHPLTAPFARELGADDWLSVQAMDISGRGVKFDAPLPRGVQLDRAARRRWSLLARHLAAAGRLHHRLQTTKTAVQGAVNPESGRTDVAIDGAGPRRELLSAARRMARAHAKGLSSEEALSLWQVLGSARWSLVATPGSGGTRSLVVYENTPFAPDPRSLSQRERTVAQLAAMGHSNKLIAYDLGIGEGSVSALLTRVRRKLRVRSRAELIKLVVALSSAPAPKEEEAGGRVAVVDGPEERWEPPAQLTSAEGEVARLAALGLSNADIAERRRVSQRTVANQLASIYDKLGIGCRAQLALVGRR
ncbi:LuxR C-terminal-related transcriptional regulator [Sorangium sp. So ce131]|uniref:LuxR C-terminal-related transcriptional regulator n=1 Tax=Sorangium sp. So ce131 TaxID=3133282 RepID=UPI003F646CEC